ncbi:ribosomal prt S3 [Enterospora canceri]|uniref:40S ribosomal protein S3 n=1 Tax=Enterospora canceri TaxID=1081671 RepID=A0A1Y1S4P7_9MICR|nr:ribosomal prt S3 [Enterospora canceri]
MLNKMLKSQTDKSSTVLSNYIREGKIRAELDELFSKMLQEETYAGVDVRLWQTPAHVGIRLLDPSATIQKMPLLISQLQATVAQRLEVEASQVRVVLEKIENMRMEPAYYAEQLRQAFVQTKPYKRVVNSVIRGVRGAGGQGVCVRVAGKVKGQRAKTTKFIDGLLIQAGEPAKQYIKHASAVAKCKQGVIGIKVSIMLPHDPEGIRGPATVLADKIRVLEPRRE